MRRYATVWAFALAVVLVPMTALAAGGIETARPWIGIVIGKGTRGVLVKEVVDKTPAQKAGLKAGDEVLSIDGTAVKEQAQLIDTVAQKGVGQKVALKIVRDKKELTITLALEAR